MNISFKTPAFISKGTGILRTNQFLVISSSLFGLKGSGSIGRAPVSKTGGWGFESLLPCETYIDIAIKARVAALSNSLTVAKQI
tara:strand:+ start:448 stop:699 length:252 start_codon:yes stop_codon:yes gene_type:complete